MNLILDPAVWMILALLMQRERKQALFCALTQSYTLASSEQQALAHLGCQSGTIPLAPARHI